MDQHYRALAAKEVALIEASRTRVASQQREAVQTLNQQSSSRRRGNEEDRKFTAGKRFRYMLYATVCLVAVHLCITSYLFGRLTRGLATTVHERTTTITTTEQWLRNITKVEQVPCPTPSSQPTKATIVSGLQMSAQTIAEGGLVAEQQGATLLGGVAASNQPDPQSAGGILVPQSVSSSASRDGGGGDSMADLAATIPASQSPPHATEKAVPAPSPAAAATEEEESLFSFW
jgi:hypothetical protein